MATPPPSIRITEVNYHPYDPPVGSPYTADDFEYIELLNSGSTAVNLQNARLASAVDFTFPNATINPDQRMLVVKNSAAFATRYNIAGLTIPGQYTGTLSDSSDSIVLLDSSNQISDQLNYSDSDSVAGPCRWSRQQPGVDQHVGRVERSGKLAPELRVRRHPKRCRRRVGQPHGCKRSALARRCTAGEFDRAVQYHGLEY